MVARNEQPVKSPAAVPGPAEYAAAGFRIIPIASDGSKAPLVEGFGKDAPEFTVAPENFLPTDGVAILGGPTPRWAGSGDWLAVIDLDKTATVNALNARIGVPLPPTLASKGYRHLYYRVPPSPERDAMRQWRPIFKMGVRDPLPVDLIWAGGYAIEPGDWDNGWDPARIAELPVEWIRAVIALRGADVAPSPRPAAAAPTVRIELGDLEVLRGAIGELAACWPQPGEGCHEAALALGGVLADSHWAEDDIARFACALFLQSGTKNRVSDVL